MPPSSALSLPVSAAPARQLSRASRPRKRKSSAEQLISAAVAFFTNVLHKTDGSYGNRPFFCTIGSDVRETSFSPKENLPRSVFCFFSSRKENVPLLFFLEEKKQKKINCGAAFFLRSCCFRQCVTQNGRFTYEPSVFPFLCRTCGRTSFLRSIIYPAVSFVSFLQEKKTFPYQEKKNVPPSFSIYANKQSKTHGHMQTVRFGRCCVLSEKAEKSECVPRAAGSPPPTVGGPRRMQRRVQRSSASCTGRSPYRACPV